MNTIKKTLVSGLAASALFTMSACGAQDDEPATKGSNSKNTTVHVNTDPKKGWVKVFGEKANIKRCDGPNLVYRLTWDSGYGTNYSQSVVSNAKECIR